MLPGKAGAPVPPAAFAGACPPAPPHGMMRPPMPGPGMMLPGWGGGFGHLMAQQLGGGMTPPYGHFMSVHPIPPPPAPGGPGTPWIQFAVDPGQISQMATPGAFLEIVNLDPQTQQADGSTSLVQITTVHPPDAAGAYCEFEFFGSSWPARSQALLMACQGGAVLHLCAGVCQITPGGRMVLHVTVARLRQPQDLSEVWILPNPPLQAMRAFLAKAGGAQPGHSLQPGPLPPQPSVAAAPKTKTGEAAAAPEEKPKGDKKRHKKLLKLLKKAKSGSQNKVTSSLLKRAKKQLAPPKETKDDSTSSDSSDFHDAPSREGGQQQTRGSRIAKLAFEAPGTLPASGLAEVAKYLQARGGVSESEATALAPMMLTYFRSVWQGAHPASEVGSRNNSEMEMLAGVIDKLLEGDLAGVGDRLMQVRRNIYTQTPGDSRSRFCCWECCCRLYVLGVGFWGLCCVGCWFVV